MQVTGRACDVCEKFAASDETPPDWFLVKRPGQMDGEAQEACSPGCLCKLGRQIKAMPTVDGFMCPNCPKVYKTQGRLEQHRTREHG